MAEVTSTGGQRPSLRDERRETTRARILEATADLVREHGSSDIPLTAVAARAGIGERTLYRYFPTKLELFEALFEWMTRRDGPPTEMSDPAGLVTRAGELFTAFEQHPELIRALAVGRTDRIDRAERRRSAVRAALHAEADALPEPRRTHLLAAVHLLTSSDAFLHANDFWGLDAAEVAAMSGWAVRALLAGKDLPDEEVP